MRLINEKTFKGVLMEKKVFISYSSKDESVVHFFVQTLEKNGVKCWWSKKDLDPLSNWASEIFNAIKPCDYFIVVISENSISSGQVINEIKIASNLNKPKLPVRLSNVPLTEELAYHLSLNAIDYYKMTDDDFFKKLLEKIDVRAMPESVVSESVEFTHKAFDVMKSHTSSIFDGVTDLGGFSWGENKSAIQNLDGGWLLQNVIIEQYDDTIYSIPEEYKAEYEKYCGSPEFRRLLLRGQNLARIMLTEFSAFQNKLFLSLKKTEWSHVRFFWDKIFGDFNQRKEAIESFFMKEETEFPNSLCLHLIVIDSENRIVASRINSRKKNDYPSTIAVTLGEQMDHSDLVALADQNCLIYWMRRALIEEFGFSEAEYHRYFNEGTARIMALDVEGDIFNISLVCCVKVSCTCEELSEYYSMHRSMSDEFNEVFPITLDEAASILDRSNELIKEYHPSSFLRLLYGYIYTAGKIPLS